MSKTIKITVEIEDWPEDMDEQCQNMTELEQVEVPHGEVVEARAVEVD